MPQRVCARCPFLGFLQRWFGFVTFFALLAKLSVAHDYASPGQDIVLAD